MKRGYVMMIKMNMKQMGTQTQKTREGFMGGVNATRVRETEGEHDI